MNVPVAQEPRTAQDGYNRLLAIAFEERVNAQAYSRQVEEKLAMAGQALEATRAELQQAKADNAKLGAQLAELLERRPKPAPVTEAVNTVVDSAGGHPD